jgi:iron complex outermembrane recepter protein
MTNRKLARAVKLALLGVGAAGVSAPAVAQDEAPDDLEEITVTGTRITAPGLESSSPVYSIGEQEIELQQQPEIEKILRLLPITAPDQGENVNNGSAGVSTIDLRGLGAQRNLIMVDGKRLTPYNIFGRVDVSTIPTALIERIDIVTGGASAVYGSDAISGAINFIMKRDFEGIDITSYYTQTDEQDGDHLSASITMGVNSGNGRGNVVANLNWSDREGVLMGSRALGTLGIVSEDGDGLAEFLAGQGPEPAPAGCGGPDSVAVGGSTTTLPTRVAIFGGPALGQFRDDGSLGSDCSVYNFNPTNYYQTPLERMGGMVLGHYTMNDHAEAYGRFAFSSTEVTQQVAASGVFGSSFFTPLSNPFISNQALQTILDAANAGVAAGSVNGPGVVSPDDPEAFLTHNWNDVNGDGAVDEGDDLLIQYRRRTVEFGPRSTAYDNNAFSMVTGLRGDLIGEWDYDLSFQYGESERTNISAGYTNLANIANAIEAIPDPLTGETVCRSGAPGCVPLNLFGGFGAITPDQAAYSSATAIEKQTYSQMIYTASVSGVLEQAQLPWASLPLAVSVGTEYREEEGETTPDECLKLAPASCLGGAGGNTLPIVGGFDVSELFGEFILPIVSDRAGFESLNLEAGYRWADYDPTGVNRTWKYGLNWQPTESLMFRVMQQRAARAPNVGELAAPRVTSLDNASFDPCSVGNPDPIDAELRALCISTGMSGAQVGTVEDIVSGQINTFSGTDLTRLPHPEEADTTTVGIVWTPDFADMLINPVLSVDYYNIEINDVIGVFSAQEILDACYDFGLASECAKIHRLGGTLTADASGLETFTTNLDYLQAEGVEVGYSFGFGIGDFGTLTLTGNINHYLTQESQSALFTPVIDCKGVYDTSCGAPLPETRWINRTIWDINDEWQVSMLWRHIGEVDVSEVQRPDTFEQFRTIDSFNYVDLVGSWQFNDQIRLSLSINNVFGEDPPVVGNEAGSTTFNGGNTFPSHYDVLGSVYTVGFNATF